MGNFTKLLIFNPYHQTIKKYTFKKVIDYIRGKKQLYEKRLARYINTINNRMKKYIDELAVNNPVSFEELKFNVRLDYDLEMPEEIKEFILKKVSEHKHSLAFFLFNNYSATSPSIPTMSIPFT